VKALVLSALGVDAINGEATLRVLETALAERGYHSETIDCTRARIIPCTGCSSCGLKTPGRCVVNDDMQGVLRKMVASDVLVLATPVRFGTYCAELKKVIDRFQPLMVPIYVVRDGEMHFRGRYDLPLLVGVGLVRAAGDGGRPSGEGGTAAEGDAFRFLIGRLALNIDTGHAATAFAGGDEALARAEVGRALDAAVATAGVAS
jgi:multimeric flavodoxin WrbA